MDWKRKGDREIELKLDCEIYSQEVIHKAIYWFLDEWTFDMKIANSQIHLSISCDKDVVLDDKKVEEVVRKLLKNLVDFKTRAIINMETFSVRELLIAKAFSHTDEFDELPPGSLNDTVGVDYKEFS